MICKKCGASNDDSATYCKECGYRLDGKKSCPVCGAFIPEDSKYCATCGARVDGKIVCPTCGTAYEGNFCPDCGRSVNGVLVNNNVAPVAPVAAAVEEKKPRDKAKLNRIMTLVSSICIFAAAMLSVLFTFCIGMEVDSNGVYTDDFIILYDYFGKIYSNLLVDDFATLFPLIVGTLVSVAAIVLILVFGIITLIRGIRYFTKKEEKGLVKYSFCTYFVFIATSAIIRMLNAVSYNDGVSHGEIVLNGATVCGIVFTGICLLGFIVCRIIANAQSFKGKQNILITCFRGSIFLLLIIAAGLVCSTAISVTNGQYTMSYGFGTLITLNTAGGEEGAVGMFVFSCVCGIVLNVAVLCLLIKAICNLIRSIVNGEKFNFLGIILPAAILSTFSFVFSIFAAVLYYGANDVYALTYDNSAGAYVLCFFATVAEIVGYNIYKKMSAPVAVPAEAASAEVAEEAVSAESAEEAAEEAASAESAEEAASAEADAEESESENSNEN